MIWHRAFWVICPIIFLFGAGIFLTEDQVYYSEEWREDTILNFDGVELKTEISDNHLSRAKGVAGRKSIPVSRAMLFVFDYEGAHGIWMKGVRFSIDIIWLDKEKKVVHIQKSVNPNTFFEKPPRVFYPDKKALYVLETKGGWAEGVGLGIDSIILFEGASR